MLWRKLGVEFRSRILVITFDIDPPGRSSLFPSSIDEVYNMAVCHFAGGRSYAIAFSLPVRGY